MDTNNKKNMRGPAAAHSEQIVERTGFTDGRRKFNQSAPKHRGNTYREPKWTSGQKSNHNCA